MSKFKLSNTSATYPLAVGKFEIQPSSYIIVDEWDLNYLEHLLQVNSDVAGTALTIEPYPEDYNSDALSVGTVPTATTALGVSLAESGSGNFHTTKFTFTNTALALTDEAGVVAYGGLKLYDFPKGYIYMQSAVSDIALTKSSTGVIAAWDGDFGVGTTTAGNNNALATTEQNIIPTTATPQASAGVTTADGVSTATEHAILDGTSAALDLFINFLVDDADHDVTTTPCRLILNGTLTVNWLFMGDN